MTQSTDDLKKKTLEKWAPILDSMGVSGSKADWLSQYAQMHSDSQNVESNTLSSTTQSDSFDMPLLPIAIKIAAQTIGTNIGGFASEEEINAVKARVQSENRDGKIDSVIEDREFTEKKLEDDPEYKELRKKGVTPLSAPSGQLFYMDYRYDDSKDPLTGKD
jgi:hypothetical protein